MRTPKLYTTHRIFGLNLIAWIEEFFFPECNHTSPFDPAPNRNLLGVKSTGKALLQSKSSSIQRKSQVDHIAWRTKFQSKSRRRNEFPFHASKNLNGTGLMLTASFKQFGAKQHAVWYQTNWKTVNTIRLRSNQHETEIHLSACKFS